MAALDQVMTILALSNLARAHDDGDARVTAMRILLNATRPDRARGNYLDGTGLARR